MMAQRIESHYDNEIVMARALPKPIPVDAAASAFAHAPEDTPGAEPWRQPFSAHLRRMECVPTESESEVCDATSPGDRVVCGTLGLGWRSDGVSGWPLDCDDGRGQRHDGRRQQLDTRSDHRRA